MLLFKQWFLEDAGVTEPESYSNAESGFGINSKYSTPSQKSAAGKKKALPHSPEDMFGKSRSKKVISHDK